MTVVKPIVYGNIARYFGKKREEDGHTHEWTVYLKPFHNEDMSTYVKKVSINGHSLLINIGIIIVSVGKLTLVELVIESWSPFYSDLLIIFCMYSYKYHGEKGKY